MDVKKLLGGLAVVAVVGLGTGVGAEPVKGAPPVPQKGASPAPQETLHIKAGQSHDLPLKGMTRIAIGDPEVVDVKVTGDVIHITGLKKGETSMLVWSGKDDKRAYTLSVK